MSGINNIDLKAFVSKTLTDVFDTMLSMDLKQTDDGRQDIDVVLSPNTCNIIRIQAT